MAEQEITLIIHGYSDCSESFVGIKEILKRNAIPATTVYYADYESREDNLTFNDIIDGLNDQLIKLGLINRDGTRRYHFNVIVHSTGGLVIRHWIWRYYSDRIDKCPIKRLIMLAPANFGSPLAARGKSFLGKLFKGRWKIGDFLEVGRQILDGLELASPYQWDLTHKDLLIPYSYYNGGQIQTTVLVGIKDYDGLRGWINKPGTDGTVVISGTPLSTVKLLLDFSLPKNEDGTYTPAEWEFSRSACEFAFGVLPDLNHGTIVDMAGIADNQASRLMLNALRVTTREEFNAWRNELDQVTEQTYNAAKKPRYQQFVLHTIDDQGMGIDDYSVEFFVFRASRAAKNIVEHSDFDEDEKLKGPELKYSNMANSSICKEFIKNSSDGSFRRFLVDPDQVLSILDMAKKEMNEDVVLSMKVYVDEVDDKIGYDNEEIQKIVLHNTGEEIGKYKPSLFYPNTTTFIELKVNRFNDYVVVGLDQRRH